MLVPRCYYYVHYILLLESEGFSRFFFPRLNNYSVLKDPSQESDRKTGLHDLLSQPFLHPLDSSGTAVTAQVTEIRLEKKEHAVS